MKKIQKEAKNNNIYNRCKFYQKIIISTDNKYSTNFF